MGSDGVTHTAKTCKDLFVQFIFRSCGLKSILARICQLLPVGRKMLSKHSLGCDLHTVSPAKRLRLNVGDLFLSNAISAQRTATLLSDAQASGSAGVADLQRLGHPKHTHRNLLTKLLKGSKWPKPYYHPVRVWNRHTERREIAQILILLPHEIIHALRRHTQSVDKLFSRGGMDPLAEEHLANACRELGLDGGGVLGLSFWLDGVVCKWDRSSAVDMLTMGLPGLEGKWADLRIPLVTVEHCWVLKHESFDDILELITWSLQQCAIGVFATERQDKQPWKNSDAKRKVMAGKPLGCKGLICQVTGDWKMYKDVFRFPQHNEISGCCYKCRATPADIRNVGPDAPWRGQRLGHWAAMQRMLERGLALSPLFSAPGLRLCIFRIDWFHVSDLGVTPDWLGALFTFLLPKFAGGRIEQRVQELWLRIQELYVVYPPGAKLDTLTRNMLSPDKPSPKLKSYGAETRGLVPIAVHLANEMLADDDMMELSVKQATRDLAACYDCLSHDAPFAADRLCEHSRRFMTMLVALEVQSPEIFRVKPKHHLFQELCEMELPNRPAAHWTYREEEFGGTIARMGERRGGANTAASMGKQVLNKFCARHKLPDFL